jgi:hypothetical protein
VNRLSPLLLAVTAVLTVTLALFESARADEFYRHYKHHVRVAYAEPDPTYDSACSVGWWQTLRYGHVRPQWGVRCRWR